MEEGGRGRIGEEARYGQGMEGEERGSKGIGVGTGGAKGPGAPPPPNAIIEGAGAPPILGCHSFKTD